MPKAIRGLRVKEPPATLLVNRDSATRRARRLDVESDVGKLGFALRSVRSQEIVPAFYFHWQLGCFGWRAQFIKNSVGSVRWPWNTEAEVNRALEVKTGCSV